MQKSRLSLFVGFLFLLLTVLVACQRPQKKQADAGYIVQVSLGSWHSPDYTAQEIIGRIDSVGKLIPIEKVIIGWSIDKDNKAVENVDEKVVESVALGSKQISIWLRIDGDFRPGERGGKDAANFYYSLDGEQWTKIGTNDYRMRFDWQRFFMGSKFAIFCYATKKLGGWVDVDSFTYHVDEK